MVHKLVAGNEVVFAQAREKVRGMVGTVFMQEATVRRE